MNRTSLSVIALAVGAVLIIALYNVYKPAINNTAHDVFDKVRIGRMESGQPVHKTEKQKSLDFINGLPREAFMGIPSAPGQTEYGTLRTKEIMRNQMTTHNVDFARPFASKVEPNNHAIDQFFPANWSNKEIRHHLNVSNTNGTHDWVPISTDEYYKQMQGALNISNRVFNP